MQARLFALPAVCAALVAGPTAAAYAQSTDSEPPADCFQGVGSTCVQNSDGSWTSEPDSGSGDGGGGIPGGVVFVMVLAGVAGIGFTIWKVSMARQMATEAGLDPGRATAVTLLTEDGLDAAYIASSLRNREDSRPPPAPEPAEGAAERLRELQQLRADGLVTADEYDARRRAIIDSV